MYRAEETFKEKEIEKLEEEEEEEEWEILGLTEQLEEDILKMVGLATETLRSMGHHANGIGFSENHIIPISENISSMAIKMINTFFKEIRPIFEAETWPEI